MLFGCGVDENNLVTSEDTTTPGSYTSAEEVMAIIKNYGDTIPRQTLPSDVLMAPGSGEWQVEKLFTKQETDNMTIDVTGVEKPVKLRVPKRSLMVQELLISMRLFLEVVQDELGTLYVEFGPSGMQFDPHVVLKIPFELLLTDQVDTFVATDEYGNEIDGVSYEINYDNELRVVYIPHFSEYYFNRR